MIINKDDLSLINIQTTITNGASITIRYKNLIKLNEFINIKKDYLILDEILIINYKIINIEIETLLLSITCDYITSDKSRLREIKLNELLNKIIK